MAELKTFREQLLDLSPPWLRAYWSERFMGLVLGYVHDVAAEALGFALRQGWIADNVVPVDALPHQGRNFGLRRYPIETPPQFITRMRQAWDLWEHAGHESPIESQLATLGFVGAQVFTPGIAAIDPVGYWSHFVVYFPLGSHPIWSAGPAWGSFSWGEQYWGPVGISGDELETIRAVIRQWKPADWICRAIVFQLTGTSWGTSPWGSFTWGGDHAIEGP